MYDEECDEVIYEEAHEKSEQEEWFQADCQERARDMQDYFRGIE